METRASYLLVGAFVLVLLAGLLGFAGWLARVELDREFAHYLIYFHGSVTGLKDGSHVRYRGIPVGGVIDLRIDPNNVEQVEVTIEVARDTPIKEDAVASLEIQGITGGAYVQIAGGTQAAPPLTAKPGERYPVITSRPSRLEEVIESAPELINRFIVLLSRATELLNEDNQRDFAETLANLRRITGALARHSGDVENFLADAAATSATFRELAGTLDLLARDLRRETTRLAEEASGTMATLRTSTENAEVQVEQVSQLLLLTLADVSDAAQAMTRMADQVDGLIAENRAPLRDFSTSGLYELSQLLTEARVLVSGLARITSEVERDATRFLFSPQQGYQPE